MHRGIVKNFKNYYMFGFTGTPIFRENADVARNPKFPTTEQLFGKQLHCYNIVDAIRDHNVLPFRVEYCETMKPDPNMIDEKVKDIDRKGAYDHSKRIECITRYILEHFNQKTCRGDKKCQYDRNISEGISVCSGNEVQRSPRTKESCGFNSIFAVSSVEAAKAFYREFKKQTQRYPSKRIKFAVIYSCSTNEDQPDGILDEENLEDPSGLNSSDRDFFEKEALPDYRDMFGNNCDFSPNGFQNYYKDISLRMKNRELDMLIVVNMFLTGFDAPTVNTLWVDKNLKMHGLLQAFSRTNRILSSVKSFGNVVCFRNLSREVKEALALFGDKNAVGIALIRCFADYYNGYEFEGKRHPGYIDMIWDLKKKFPLQDFPIVKKQDQKEFITLFGSVLRCRNLLVAFDEFEEKELLKERELQDYIGRYRDLQEEWKGKKDEATADITDDIIFEVELVDWMEIGIDEILILVEGYQKDRSKNKKDFLDGTARAINASFNLRSKKDLILNFIKGIKDGDDIGSKWYSYVEEHRKKELAKIVEEEHLDEKATCKFMEDAFRNGEVETTGDSIRGIMPHASFFNDNDKSSKKKDRILSRLKKFFEKFFGIGGSEKIRIK